MQRSGLAEFLWVNDGHDLPEHRQLFMSLLPWHQVGKSPSGVCESLGAQPPLTWASSSKSLARETIGDRDWCSGCAHGSQIVHMRITLSPVTSCHQHRRSSLQTGLHGSRVRNHHDNSIKLEGGPPPLPYSPPQAAHVEDRVLRQVIHCEPSFWSARRRPAQPCCYHSEPAAAKQGRNPRHLCPKRWGRNHVREHVQLSVVMASSNKAPSALNMHSWSFDVVELQVSPFSSSFFFMCQDVTSQEVAGYTSGRLSRPLDKINKT